MSTEVQCNSCIHEKVCVNKPLFIEAQMAANDIVLDREDKVSVMLTSIPWIHPIKLYCNNFKPEQHAAFRK